VDEPKQEKRDLWDFILHEWDLVIFVIVIGFALILGFFDKLDKKFESSAFLMGFALIGINLYKSNRSIIKEVVSSKHYLSADNDKTQQILIAKMGEIEKRAGEGSIHIVERCDKELFYINLQSSVARAQKTVDLTNLDLHEPNHYGIQVMSGHFGSVSEVIRKRPSVQFRRICTAVEADKVLWLIRTVRETQDLGNFNVRVIDLSKSPIKMISLQIIDDSETLIVDPATGAMEIGKQVHLLWVRGKHVAESLSLYYESNWRNAKTVKEGCKIDKRLLESMVRRCSEHLGNDAELVKKMHQELSQIVVEQIQ